jgi:hypothetical protein
VSPTYFDVLRIPMLRGRAFQDADAPASLPVAIINQTMARRFWPDRDPLGEQVRQLTADIYRVMAIGAQSRSSPCSSGLRS